jgi:hypothetical protein
MEKKSIGSRIHGIDLLEKLLIRTDVQEKEDFNFDIKMQSALDHNRKLVIVLVDVVIKKSNEATPVAKFATATGFDVVDFDIVFAPVEDKITIPIDLENLFKSICISTMRGIIFSELRGTILGGAIMPIIGLDTLKPLD